MLVFACGGGATGTPALRGNVTLLAGNVAGPGNFDAAGAAAGFFSPNGIAVDAAGNVFVADSGNHSIRRITPAGVVSTFAGMSGQPGTADGNGTAARLNNPAGIAFDSAGNLVVADTGNSTIRRITVAGDVSTLAGDPLNKGSVDGLGAAARFDAPWAVTVDAAGNVYVADSADHTIRRITPAGLVSTFAGAPSTPGSVDATGSAARFNAPSGIAFAAGNVYVADTENHTVRRISSTGAVTTIAGSAGVQGAVDATGAAASFSAPAGIATATVGGNLSIFVADSGNSTIRSINAAGAVSTLAGTPQAPGGADGQGGAASFSTPNGVAVDAAGQVLIADTGNHTVRRVTAAGAVSTLAGTAPALGSADGSGAAATFFAPRGLATDTAGNVYVADTLNRSVRLVNAGGVVSTLSLSGGGFSSNVRPEGITVDGSGNVFVSDQGGAVFKLIPSTGEVIAWAGTLGAPGSADGPGASASFNLPAGIAADASGNVYVADSGNATIRRIDVNGNVSTLAGTPGALGSADGTGSAAQFAQPWGIATDEAGNVYVADRVNNNIRRITPAGAVTTLAGDASQSGSADGVGAAATFNQPRGITVDGANNVYVADTNNYAVRAITPRGAVTTIVGVPGRRGFTPGPFPGTLADPVAIAVSRATLYILVNNAVASAQ